MMISLPPVVVGTSSMGSVLPDALVSRRAREDAFAHLDSLLEIGCRAFDLAASYQVGGTERLFGAWIASRRNRDDVVLVTKGAHPLPVVAPHRLDARSITADLDASLRRLRVERVDLYMLHRDDAQAPLEPVARALSDAHASGKLASWGVSNFTHARLRALDDLARSAGLPPVAASSPHFSLFDWAHPPFSGCVSIAGEAGLAQREAYAREPIAILAWSPLGSGFVASRGGSVYASAQNRGRLERAERIARARAVRPAAVALAYLVNQPFPVHPIVASRSAETMRANLAAASMRLSEAEVRWLEKGGEPPPM